MRMMGSVKTTKYEIALRGPAGFYLPLGWTAKKTKRSLWIAMLDNGPTILERVPLPKGDDGFVWSTKHQAWEWNDYQIAFTGNTKAR